MNAQGFKPTEISVGAVDVTDHSTDENFKKEKGPRFIVAQSITVNTVDVDRVQEANSKTADLIRAGVVVSSGGVSYKFNGLNALKPDMITEATRNARAAADRFAADSGSQVGAIRDADQGTFSISAASAGADVDTGGGYGADQQADASIMKKVRVVATIDYYLKN